MDYLKQLEDALAAERSEAQAVYAEQLKLGPAEQRRLGIALFPIKVTDQESSGMQTMVSFSTSFPINDAYFRRGCTISYQAGDASGEGRLAELDVQSGSFVVNDEDPPDFRDEQVTLRFVPDDRTMKCMSIGLRLAGEKPELIAFAEDFKECPAITSTFSLPELNASQNEAVSALLGEKPTVVIQGPPGTGKTTMLSMAIRELVKAGKRVIISAPSNTATDNLCHRLIVLDIPLLRVGNEEKMSDLTEQFTVESWLAKGRQKSALDHMKKALRKAEDTAFKYVRNLTGEAKDARREAKKEVTQLRREIRGLMREEENRLLHEVPVIAGTPVGLFNELPKDFQTDVVIIDEAGQSTEPLTWLTASFGKRLVLCGDPMQLPPVVLSYKAQSLGLGKSLLERVSTKENTLLLNEQYRMAPEIVAAINPYFYDNQLQTALKHQGELLFIDMAGYGEGESQDETSGSTFNADEAAIAKRVSDVIDLKAKNTVVLSPYNAQLGVLKKELGPEWKISTIDSMQGQEAEHILISLTRSNDMQEIGFLKDYRRTNVAVSRAKSKCIIIGDSSTIGGDPFYGKLIDHIEQAGGYKSAWEFEA